MTKSHFALLATLFVGLVIASHAAVSPEEYWKKKLPNTPIPKVIQDSLRSDGDTSVSVGGNGVDVSTGKPGKGAHVNVGTGGVDVDTGTHGTNVHVGNNGVNVNAGKPGKGADVHVGSGGVNVHAGGKGKHVTVTVPGQPSPFIYRYAASEDQLHDNPNVALFFLEKDLKPGNKMMLHFTKSTNDATFLPRDEANSIPFSSDKIPEILARFKLPPGSDEAKVISETVKECQDDKGVDGEEKHCATSLEEMLDLTTSMLGKDPAVVVTTHAQKESPLQNYLFKGVKPIPATDSVVCHKQNYAYAVFYCHKTRSTNAYVVSLLGADGLKIKAAVVCHKDTSKWNPRHLAFQVLKVHPGSVPICHFLPEDHILWVPKSVASTF